MSGIEIVGAILALYPIAVDLAKGYKQMKWNDSELHRVLLVASQLYDRTVKDLLTSAVSYGEMQRLVPSNGPINHRLWKDEGLQQKLQDRLGPHKFPLAMQHLTEMKTLLDQVQLELPSMSRVMSRWKLKTKMALAHMPHSKVHERVKRVRVLNEDLRKLLDERPIIRPHQQYLEESTIILNVEMTASGGVKACEFYEAVKKTYTCACSTPHAIGLGCYCTDCVQPLSKTATLGPHSDDQWEFCLAFPPSIDNALSASSPAAVLLQTIPEADDPDVKAQMVDDICSLVSGVTKDCDFKIDQVLIDTASTDTKTYRMKVAKIVSDVHHVSQIKSFTELRCDAGLSRKARLELAIRLSLTILQLCKTPWIDDSWTWTDVCVSQVTTSTRTTAIKQHGDLNNGSASPTEEPPPATPAHPLSAEPQSPVMFFLGEIYSVTYDAEAASTAATIIAAPRAIDLMDTEPVMTKLGMALIELALRESIQDMKEGYGLDGMSDQDVANICTARALLEDGKIRRELSKGYEGVVKACIERQYHDERGTLRAVASRDDSFLSSFRDAIILPLYKLWNDH
ncbi:hypothetical protein QBC39DRAFT_430261 [Podospora conica]|nr:hypothetical protein QBC39DRAFT_430261 [Schizothecium conicum]